MKELASIQSLATPRKIPTDMKFLNKTSRLVENIYLIDDTCTCMKSMKNCPST